MLELDEVEFIVVNLSPLALREDVVVEEISEGLRIWTLKQIRLKCSHIWLTTDAP